MSEIKKALTIEDISFKYTDKQVIKGVTFKVKEGELYGIVGPDGAGKSTLLKLISTVHRPQKGKLTVLGLKPNENRDLIKRKIGYLSQEFNLYPDLTVLENLEFLADLFEVSKKDREKRINYFIDITNLRDKVDTRAKYLSGGMKQKLALICSLIHDPELLLLDEPTTGIDPLSRWEFWDFINILHGRGKTIVVATPYLNEAERCEKVLFLDEGKVLYRGDMHSLLADIDYKFFTVKMGKPDKALLKLKELSGVVDIEPVGKSLQMLTEKNIDKKTIKEALNSGPEVEVKEKNINLEKAFQILMKELK